MDSSFIITFIGDDRPGLVEALSATISEQGGNWQESQLSQLSGKFAGLIRVSLPADRGQQLQDALKALSEKKDLSVRVTPVEEVQASTELSRHQLAVIGPDRSGIVREISAALLSHNINVVEFESQVEPAPMSAEPMFSASIIAEVDSGADLEALTDALDGIANDMLLDIQLEPLP